MANYEIFQHAEYASSPNPIHHICQMKHVEYNRTHREVHKFYKECVDKKWNKGTTIDLEVEDVSDEKSDNTAITNERYDMFHNSSVEIKIKIKIANERCDVLCKNSDEGNMTATNERHDNSQNKYDKGSTSIMQNFDYKKYLCS